MKRNVPKNIIGVLLHWLTTCSICVKWKNALSSSVPLLAGVRQGGILSPIMFSIYMDALIVRLRSSGFGCNIAGLFVGCLLYADDIMLLSHSVTAMHRMLVICQEFALEFDLKFNTTKSVVIRIGDRWKVQCAPLLLCDMPLLHVDVCKYLGVHIIAGKKFSCSLDEMRHKFYRMFNCIYARSSTSSSELVTVHLMRSYCLPILLYCSEVIPIYKADFRSLNRCIDSVIYKVFAVHEQANIALIRQYLGLDKFERVVEDRINKFLNNVANDVQLCWFTSKCLPQSLN